MIENSYSDKEEKLNILSHAIGILLSSVGLILLIIKSQGFVSIASTVIFGLSLIILYTASTLYHASKQKDLRAKLRVFDHAAIFILIAGTYTPVCLITLKGNIGNTLLMIIWVIGISGVVLKLFFTGKYSKLSTMMYVGMGWVAVFAINPLVREMSNMGLIWLAIGGLCYTIGAILYSFRSLPYNHFVFHLFVLLGSASHFLMIYLYII